ncbi:hypothetical protein Tco_0007479 [Tanacetum coccineum]
MSLEAFIPYADEPWNTGPVRDIKSLANMTTQSDIEVFKQCHMSDASGSPYELSLVETKSIGVSGDNMIIENQIFWILQKVLKSEDDVDMGAVAYRVMNVYLYMDL